jgi:protein KRI1
MTVDFQDPRGEIENGEEFLIDFIKNKRWIDRTSLSEINDKNDAEMMDKDDDNGREPEAGDDSSLEDIDRADDFEAKYNFRYEEAEAAAASSGAHLSVRTYARGQTMNTVRRNDTARKDKRQARKERKAAERKAKEEQLKRLKNAKRQEMERKLSQVKAVLGNVDDDVIDEAAIMKMLEGDYDPENFEKAMKEAYGDEFYEKEDSEWKSDMDVRQSLEQDEDGEALVGADDENGGLYDNSNEGFDDDGPYDAENTTMEDEKYNEDEEWVNAEDDQHNQEETELERKLKAKIEDDLYKLDYEDIVAGMPTRFKYRQVEPNDYGLTTQEILFARDLTLKQFVSLKKMAPYNEQGEYHVGSRKRRKFREMLKQDLEELIPEAKDTHDETAVAILNTQKEHDTDDNTEPKKKKRRRLKKGKKKDAHEAQEGLEDNKEKEPPVEDKRESKSFDEKHNESKTSKPKKTKKKKNSNKHGNKVAGISGSRLASYGL